MSVCCISNSVIENNSLNESFQKKKIERHNGLYLLLQVFASTKRQSKKKKNVRIEKELLLGESK